MIYLDFFVNPYLCILICHSLSTSIYLLICLFIRVWRKDIPLILNCLCFDLGQSQFKQWIFGPTQFTGNDQCLSQIAKKAVHRVKVMGVIAHQKSFMLKRVVVDDDGFQIRSC